MMFRLQPCMRLVSQPLRCNSTRLVSTISEERIKQCYRTLNVPINSNQDIVKKAFLELAKKYHPDSGHEAASIDRFCEIEDAFRVLTKKNTGSTAQVDEIMEYDIRHTAPQHRQYLSYGGLGHGTPAQREKQYAQLRAERAAENVMEHRISRAMAAESTLIKKEDIKKKHDIKTQYGFDRLVEDLIQESMSKGEFNNLSGTGKPLKGQNYNPYVDFTTHKINEVLINNGFTPEWITLNKDIREEVAWMKRQLNTERGRLGPLPLSEKETIIWKNTCDSMREYTKKINSRIMSFNLIVPLFNKQMFLLKFEEISEEVLKNGKFRERVQPLKPEPVVRERKSNDPVVELVKTIVLIISFIYKTLKNVTPKLKE